MKKFLITSVYLFLLASCIHVDQPQNYERTFFDLKDLIDEQRSQYEEGVEVEKRITVGDVVENKNIGGYDYASDLEQFSTYNLNKPAMYDKYEVDSVIHDGYLETEIYRALEEDLVVKKMEIHYEGQQVDSVVAEVEFRSIIVEAKTHLHLLPGKGYTLQVEEDRLTGDPVFSQVKLRLIGR